MDSSINGTTTSLSKEESLTVAQITSLVIYCVIFVLGVIGNGLVIYVTGLKMKTTVNSVWFLNLALADFLFTLFLIFAIIRVSLNNLWPFGDFMCKFYGLVQVSTMFASIFLLTVISLDRCLTIWAVIWSHNKRTPNKARLICVFVWLLSLACSIPFTITRGVIKNKCQKTSDYLTTKNLAMSRFVVGFVIPFFIITSCQVAIGVRARRSHRKKKIRPFLIILAVILAFFICWLPLQIIDLIMAEQYYSYTISQPPFNWDVYNKARKILPVAISLAYLNSCLNPFLYIFMCEEFKQKLKRSVFLVLEHAFAEEHLVYFSSQFSVVSRQSASSGQNQEKATQGPLMAFSGTSEKGSISNACI